MSDYILKERRIQTSLVVVLAVWKAVMWVVLLVVLMVELWES